MKRIVMRLALLLIALCTVVVVTVMLLQNNEAITLQDAESKVLAAYDGTLVSSREEAEQFSITFDNTVGQYSAHVNDAGEIISLEQLKIYAEEQHTEKPEKPIESVKLTEQQAIDIAKKVFNGTLEDYEFVDSSNGGYYLIELESDTQEVEIQVHALTGEVLSAVYDD